MSAVLRTQWKCPVHTEKCSVHREITTQVKFCTLLTICQNLKAAHLHSCLKIAWKLAAFHFSICALLHSCILHVHFLTCSNATTHMQKCYTGGGEDFSGHQLSKNTVWPMGHHTSISAHFYLCAYLFSTFEIEMHRCIFESVSFLFFFNWTTWQLVP